MSTPDQQSRARIAALTISISVRSVPRIVGSLLEAKLTIQQLKALTSIVVGEGSTTSALAAEFGVSMATMSRLVDKLAAQDLVRRVPDPADQRVRRLEPTSLGRSVVGEIIGPRPELGEDVLDGLSSAELAALETGLRAIDRELHRLAAEPAAGAGPAPE